MNEPLAQRLRPKTLADVCGQQHLLAPGRVFRRTIESGRIPNMIFYGPSGTGKTTVARIIAENSGMTLHKLNGTSCGTGDIKAVLKDIGTLAAAVGDEHLLGDAHALYQFRFHPAATQVSHPLCRCLIVARGGITAHRDVHPPCTQVVDVGLQHGAKAVQLRLVAGVGHIEHVFPRHKAEHKGGIRCCCRFVLCLACQRKQCEQEGKSCSFHSSYHSLFMD